jgi:hypothetical protein
MPHDSDNNSPSWDDCLIPPADYDPTSPLVWACEEILDFEDTWVDSLLSEKPIVRPPVGDNETEFPGELEDRGVEISNFNPKTITRENVESHAICYGDVNTIDMSELDFGKIVVHFYDLRSAYAMRSTSIVVDGFQWQFQFDIPEKITNRKNPPNKGTIILFNVPGHVTDDVTRSEFGKFGIIREVRRSNQNCFVEFWDTRSSEQALESVKGHRLCGAKIAIEFSRPGGFRKNPDAFLRFRKPVVSRRSAKTKPIFVKSDSAMHY